MKPDLFKIHFQADQILKELRKIHKEKPKYSSNSYAKILLSSSYLPIRELKIDWSKAHFKDTVGFYDSLKNIVSINLRPNASDSRIIGVIAHELTHYLNYKERDKMVERVWDVEMYIPWFFTRFLMRILKSETEAYFVEYYVLHGNDENVNCCEDVIDKFIGSICCKSPILREFLKRYLYGVFIPSSEILRSTFEKSEKFSKISQQFKGDAEKLEEIRKELGDYFRFGKYFEGFFEKFPKIPYKEGIFDDRFKFIRYCNSFIFNDDEKSFKNFAEKV